MISNSNFSSTETQHLTPLIRDKLSTLTKTENWSGKYIVKNGTLEKATYLESIWEVFKGFLGLQNRTNRSLVEYTIIQFIESIEDLVQTKEDVELIQLLASRTGISEKNIVDHQELNSLINSLRNKINPNIKRNSGVHKPFEYSTSFYNKHTKELNLYAKDIMLIEAFNRAISDTKRKPEKDNTQKEEQNSSATSQEERKQQTPPQRVVKAKKEKSVPASQTKKELSGASELTIPESKISKPDLKVNETSKEQIKPENGIQATIIDAPSEGWSFTQKVALFAISTFAVIGAAYASSQYLPPISTESEIDLIPPTPPFKSESLSFPNIPTLQETVENPSNQPAPTFIETLQTMVEHLSFPTTPTPQENVENPIFNSEPANDQSPQPTWDTLVEFVSPVTPTVTPNPGPISLLHEKPADTPSPLNIKPAQNIPSEPIETPPKEELPDNSKTPKTSIENAAFQNSYSPPEDNSYFKIGGVIIAIATPIFLALNWARGGNKSDGEDYNLPDSEANTTKAADTPASATGELPAEDKKQPEDLANQAEKLPPATVPSQAENHEKPNFNQFVNATETGPHTDESISSEESTVKLKIEPESTFSSYWDEETVNDLIRQLDSSEEIILYVKMFPMEDTALTLIVNKILNHKDKKPFELKKIVKARIQKFWHFISSEEDLRIKFEEKVIALAAEDIKLKEEDYRDFFSSLSRQTPEDLKKQIEIPSLIEKANIITKDSFVPNWENYQTYLDKNKKIKPRDVLELIFKPFSAVNGTLQARRLTPQLADALKDIPLNVFEEFITTNAFLNLATSNLMKVSLTEAISADQFQIIADKAKSAPFSDTKEIVTALTIILSHTPVDDKLELKKKLSFAADTGFGGEFDKHFKVKASVLASNESLVQKYDEAKTKFIEDVKEKDQSNKNKSTLSQDSNILRITDK